MTDTLSFSCPGIVFKDLIFNEVDMKPMTSFDPKSLNLYLPQLESLNTWHTEANQELFPRKSLSQALSENIKPGSDFIGAHMRV